MAIVYYSSSGRTDVSVSVNLRIHILYETLVMTRSAVSLLRGTANYCRASICIRYVKGQTLSFKFTLSKPQ
jgi:hypothetical protein